MDRVLIKDTVIAQIESQAPRVALVLRLIFAFGLRLQEASLFRPQWDDRGDYIQVIAGTKGGRPRQVPVETAQQRDVLALVHQACETTGRSLIPKTSPFKVAKFL